MDERKKDEIFHLKITSWKSGEYKIFQNAQKMLRMQFFEYFVCSDNLLIINVLRLNSPFLYPNTTLELLTFKFLFKHSSIAANYTLLNILLGLHSPLF